ncbi:MAG: thiamine pyrophosphate-dependent enzyme, partial [Limibaculum sp.]
MTIERNLDRKQAVPALIGDPSDLLIVAGLAGTAKDIGALSNESPNVFLMGGAMGAAVPFAMGLAYAQPDRRVLAVTGDG